MVRKHTGDFRWEGVDVHPYKEEGGTHFKSITRQTLFHGDESMPFEFRYFEVQAGGYSTLEKHDHQHLVIVIRGQGEVLVGEEVTPVGLHDLVHVPPMTFHQFHANQGEPLGFLCVVCMDRDKPQRPDQETVEGFKPTAKGFVKI